MDCPQQDNDVLRAACRVLRAVCVPCVMATALRRERTVQEEVGERWVECGRLVSEREIAQLKFITMGSGCAAAAALLLPLAVAMTVADTV